MLNSSLSILVNGSPTKDLLVSRGLCQGDMLSMFLFLMVAEGLAGLVSNTTHLGTLKGFGVVIM